MLKPILTFRLHTHNPCFIAVVTIPRDKLPDPAFQQGVLVAVAAKALIVEESGAGAKVGVLQCRADLPVDETGIQPRPLSHTTELYANILD